MIKFDNCEFSNVIISSALGWGNGIGILKLRPTYLGLLNVVKKTKTTIITKTMTYAPRKGNFNPKNPLSYIKCVKKLPNGGLINTFGLTNPGVKSLMPTIEKLKHQSIVPSIYAENDYDACHCLYAISPVNAIELNISCPNTTFKCTTSVFKNIVTQLYNEFYYTKMIMKVGLSTPMELVEEFQNIGGAIVHGINTEDTGHGGVSGKPIFNKMLKFHEKLRKHTTLPVIMGGGVSSIEDVKECLIAGANGVSICTNALLNPKETARILLHYNGE